MNKRNLYKLARMPGSYHGASTNIHPDHLMHKRQGAKAVSLSSSIQKKWYTGFLEDPDKLALPYLCCFASTPTDDAAMAAACALTKTAIIHQFTNTGRMDVFCWNAGRDVDIPENVKFLMIHNLTPETPAFVFSIAREVILRYSEAFRVVVCAGSNPVDFMDNHLRLKTNAFFYFQKPVKRRSV